MVHVAAGYPPLSVDFIEMRKSDAGVVYVHPDPQRHLVQLMTTSVDAFTDAFTNSQPCGGTVRNPVPHLTAAKFL